MYQGAGFRRVGFGKPGSCLFFLGGILREVFLLLNVIVIVPTNDIGIHDTSKKDRLERFDGRVIPKVCMSLAGTINVFNRGHQK